MTEREYILAIDLGVKGTSHAMLCDERGRPTGKADRIAAGKEGYQRLTRMVPTPEQNEHLEVRIAYEATASAWMPLASYLAQHTWPAGVTVQQLRVKPQDVAQMRKVTKRHAKSDRLDAQAIAKMVALHGDALAPLPEAELGQPQMRQLARRHLRAAEEIQKLKTRLWALVQALVPGLWSVLDSTDLTKRTRTVLRELGSLRGSDRQREKRLVRAGLTSAQAEQLLRRMDEARQIYLGEKSYLDWDEAHEEVIELLDELEIAEARHAKLEDKMESLLDDKLDPYKALRSIYGISTVHASYILASVGNIDRFPNADKFVGYTGFYAVTVQSVEDPRGMRMSKAGPRMLKRALRMAAETARRWDPELARVYHVQFVLRGKEHDAAMGHVVRHLACRVYAVLKRMAAKHRAVHKAMAAGDDEALRAAQAQDVSYQLRDPRQPNRPALSDEQARALADQYNQEAKAVREQRRSQTRASGRAASRKGQREAPHEARCQPPSGTGVTDPRAATQAAVQHAQQPSAPPSAVEQPAAAGGNPGDTLQDGAWIEQAIAQTQAAMDAAQDDRERLHELGIHMAELCALLMTDDPHERAKAHQAKPRDRSDLDL